MAPIVSGNVNKLSQTVANDRFFLKMHPPSEFEAASQKITGYALLASKYFECYYFLFIYSSSDIVSNLTFLTENTIVTDFEWNHNIAFGFVQQTSINNCKT